MFMARPAGISPSHPTVRGAVTKTSSARPPGGAYVLMSLPMLGLLQRGLHGLRQGVGWVGRRLARAEEKIAREIPGVVAAREEALTDANRGHQVHIVRAFEDLAAFWGGAAHGACKYLVVERPGGTRELHVTIYDGEHLRAGGEGDLLVAAGMMTIIDGAERVVEINGLSMHATSFPHHVIPFSGMIPLAEAVGLMSARTFLQELLSTPEAPVHVQMSLGDDSIPLRFDDEHDCYVVGPLTRAADTESILNILRHDRSDIPITFNPPLAERSEEERAWAAPLLLALSPLH